MGTNDEDQAFSSTSGTISNEDNLLQINVSTGGKDTLVQWIFICIGSFLRINFKIMKKRQGCLRCMAEVTCDFLIFIMSFTKLL
jgi:hypothetical protein